jgi:hypothetical protein
MGMMGGLKAMSRDVVSRRRLPVEVWRISNIGICRQRFGVRELRPDGRSFSDLLSMARELVRPGMTVWDLSERRAFDFAAAG